MIKKLIKFMIPVCVILIVAISVVAALITREEAMYANEESVETIQETETMNAVSADNQLEADKYPEINELVTVYLNALAEGDVETYRSITNNMTDITAIRVAELGKYIDSFPAYNVFTKIGPREGSYIAFVAIRTQFVHLDQIMPGIYNLYICTDEDGKLYINEATVTAEEQAYIEAVYADSAVVEFQNSFNAEYQELMQDETVSKYIELMTSEIHTAVGTALAGATLENGKESTEGTAGDQTILYTDCQATAKDTINVRSSDSETADKIGKITKGTTFDVIEVRVNGWTKIQFEGKEAYVKTDYLELLGIPENTESTESSETAESTESVESTETVETTESTEPPVDENAPKGTVEVTTKVNVRAEANVSSTRLGQVSQGTVLEWIEDVEGGFSKIIYNGEIAYIATEYLNKQ